MLLVKETRCGVDEVRHYGAVSIVSQDIEQTFGEQIPPYLPLRSTGKPFFLGALLRDLLRSESFSNEELALMSSSHNGEPQHVSVLLGLLARYDLGPEQLKCGIQTKWREWSISSSTGNNCSGKHAAFLIGGRVAGYNLETYLDPDFPLHTLVRDRLSQVFGQRPTAIGVDGCSIPTYAFPLDAIARAFKAFAMDEIDEAHAKVRNAQRRAAFFVGGTDRLESYLIYRYGLTVKSGSEGLWVVGVPSNHLGIAVKVWDGIEAAAQAVVLDILGKRGIIDLAGDEYLRGYHSRALFSFGGFKTGELEVCFDERQDS